MSNTIKVDQHIDVLDGVRTFAVGLVVWFHFWQQSWLTPRLPLPSSITDITRYFGVTGINLEGFVRYGFLFVDLLILLSAFCNFYPYARSILLGEPWPDIKRFYFKRAARILPSYYLSLLVMLAVKAGEGNLALDPFFLKDFFTHITCISPFFPDTYLSSNFNGVLWTVQVEVLYYILMPWLAKLFRRVPVLTCGALWGCGLLSANYILYRHEEMIRVLGNHFATFAGCYANGMLLCMLYISLKRNVIENKYTCMAATLAVFACLFYLSRMMKTLSAGELQIVQLAQRFELSLVFSCFLLALPFAWKGIRFLFANRLMFFGAAISYNLYLWHQYIAVKCKEYRIPFWEGTLPPNQSGDTVWMWKYQLLILLLSFAAAVLLTYCFEKPVAKFLLKKKKNCITP